MIQKFVDESLSSLISLTGEAWIKLEKHRYFRILFFQDRTNHTNHIKITSKTYNVIYGIEAKKIIYIFLCKEHPGVHETMVVFIIKQE